MSAATSRVDRIDQALIPLGFKIAIRESGSVWSFHWVREDLYGRLIITATLDHTDDVDKALLLAAQTGDEESGWIDTPILLTDQTFQILAALRDL